MGIELDRKRTKLSNQIFKFLRTECHAEATIQLDDHNKWFNPYVITFNMESKSSGVVTVHGVEFIHVQLEGEPIAKVGEPKQFVFRQGDHVMEFLTHLYVEHDVEKAMSVQRDVRFK